MVRSPSPRQRREGTSINEAVRFRRVSINIPHTCFERAAILQRYPLVTPPPSPFANSIDVTVRPHAKAPSSKKHTHFIRKSYTMNPQSTDTRVCSFSSLSVEIRARTEVPRQHAPTSCLVDTLAHNGTTLFGSTVTTSHRQLSKALMCSPKDGQFGVLYPLRNSDYEFLL